MIRIGTSRRWRLLLAAGVLLFSTAAWAAPEQKYAAFGLVLKIDGPQRFKVSCKEIPGFMGAMVMTLDVRNRGELEAIRPGELVDFTLVVDPDSSYAETIHVHEFESPEQGPLEVRMLAMIEAPFDAKAGDGPVLKVDQKVPDFTLTDQNRHAVKFSDLSGKVVALSFVYTKCSYSQYCFRLSNNLGLVGKRFADRMDKDLVLLTVTFDPDTDSPEALAQYAHTWKASAKGWYFLTGSPENVRRVCLMFGMNFWPEMGMLVHTMHTAVIDRDGHMVANLEGNDFSAEQLGNLIETVMDRRQ